MQSDGQVICRRALLTDARDAATVVSLLDAYARDPMGGGEGLAPQVLERLPQALGQRTGLHALLALVDSQAIGVAICVEGFSTFACQPLLNIHDMAVLRDFRRRGAGAALLNAAETLARELGCCKLTLEVLSNNHAAQAAYRRAGFNAYQLDPEAGHALFWQKKL